MTAQFSNLNYKDEDTERLINGYFAKKRQQEREEKERLEREAQERINKKKKGKNLENKVQPVQNPIINSNSNLQFVTDENLYEEIVQYLDIQFPDHKDVLSRKLFFDADNKIMKGSNTYITTAIDMYLKKEIPEYRIARQIDLEQNLQMFKDLYIDSGLALRKLNGANQSEATYLFNQLKLRGLTEQDFPIWFNLQCLELDNNLNFNLTDESLYKIKAECLTWKNGTHYSEIDDFGLPEKEDESSNRQIWINNYALSAFILGGRSGLYSGVEDIAGSGESGRVVLVKQSTGGSK